MSRRALMDLAVKVPARVLERQGSQPKYRTKIPLLCVNPFTSRASDEELQFYAQMLQLTLAVVCLVHLMTSRKAGSLTVLLSLRK